MKESWEDAYLASLSGLTVIDRVIDKIRMVDTAGLLQVKNGLQMLSLSPP